MKDRKTRLYLTLVVTGTISLLTNYCFAQESSGGIFVVGGIHQSHEKATHYTYERMGEIYQQLNPDILCVETKQKYVDDGSFKETPFDFKKFMIPMAQQNKTPVYGIDWWDNEKGSKWRELQSKAFNDTTLSSEVKVFGGMFSILNQYFINKDFEEINSQYVTDLWEAKSEFKYHTFSKHPGYAFITEFETERNNHIVDNILRVVKENPNKKILVAIGIDHKYYIERELERQGVKIYRVDDTGSFSW